MELTRDRCFVVLLVSSGPVSSGNGRLLVVEPGGEHLRGAVADLHRPSVKRLAASAHRTYGQRARYKVQGGARFEMVMKVLVYIRPAMVFARESVRLSANELHDLPDIDIQESV